MKPLDTFSNKRFRICYWNTEPRILDKNRMSIERFLSQLGDVVITEISGLGDEKLIPCDLLVIAAHNISSMEFPSWLNRLKDNIRDQGQIWIPALILANATFGELNEVFGAAVKQNWYFDILSPKHLDSLPIRVANLLRIHDHLHELKRYSNLLVDLQDKTEHLEKELIILRQKFGGGVS